MEPIRLIVADRCAVIATIAEQPATMPPSRIKVADRSVDRCAAIATLSEQAATLAPPRTMKNPANCYLSLLLLAGCASPLPADDATPELWTTLESKCIACHGKDDQVEGDINLLASKTSAGLMIEPELLEKLIKVLSDSEMPPEGEPPLDDNRRASMIAQLRVLLDHALKSEPFEPTPIRRMNRFQFNNAVVDLLGLQRDIFQMNERLLRRRDDYFRPASKKMPEQVRVSSRPLSKDIDNERPEGFRGVAAFPQDQRAEHGFDNRADHLTLSPLLMESFLQLSQSIVESPDLNRAECRHWDRWFTHAKQDDRGDSTRDIDAIRDTLEPLLRLAFRRPVDPETRDSFAEFGRQRLAAGDSYQETMRAIVGAVLAMPDFLYLYETPEVSPVDDGVPGRQRVDDFELAARLAQFIWSSIPDDTLLDLAQSGKLHEPETLSAQIDRMMNDRRSSRLCDNFPGQWLQLDRLITSIPDPALFPYFYYHGYRTSMHMMSEPLLLFETLFVEDRPILQLIDADFTWQSDMLESNYEGDSKADHQVQVQTFRRVALNDPRRGGVITNAAVMTMTSTPTRTQPITRGAWVNAVIFNDPPEPPPADVPPLPEADEDDLSNLTIRERLAMHRKRVDCAGCHNKIDPLGFALENYGPTGVWRDAYKNGREVDAGGVLFRKHEFDTVAQFKQHIVEDKERFYRAFIAHLLSYALGRQLGPADSPALDQMTGQAVEDDRMRSVLKRIAMSEPFLHKNVSHAEP